MTTRRIENLLKSVNNRLQSMLDFDGFYAVLYDSVRSLVEFPVVVLDGQPQEWITRPYQAALWLLDSIIDTKAYQLIEQDFECEVGKIGLKYWPHWFSVSVDCVEELDRCEISAGLQAQFKYHSRELTSEALLEVIQVGNAWAVVDGNQKYSIKNEGQTLNVYRLPQSWLAVPMIVEDQVIGVLVMENRRRSKCFGDNGVRVLTTVARQTAVAIENARLVDQRDRKITALKTLYEMGQKLNSEIRADETAILEVIHQQAKVLMDTTNLYIAFYDQATDVVSFPLMFVDGKATAVESRSGGKGRTEWIVHNREPIFIETCGESLNWYKEHEGTEYIDEAFASWVGVPMIAGDKVLGIIATYHKTQDYVYTKDDQEILSLMANQAAVAIENARLYGHLEEMVQERTSALQKRNKQLAALQEIGAKMTSQLKLEDVLGSIADDANAIMYADFSTLFPYDPVQNKFEVGFRKGRIDVEPTVPSAHGFTARIAKTQRSFFVENVADEQGVKREFIEAKGVRSFAGVPLLIKDKVVGVLYINYRTSHKFSDDERETILLLANQAAVAIENARLYQELKNKQSEIADKERALVMTSLAMDFVHEINNLAGTIAPWLNLAKESLRHIAGVQDTKALEYMAKAERDAALMLRKGQEFRYPVAGLHEVNIEELIGSVVGQIAMMVSPEIEFTFESEPNLPPIYAVERQLSTAVYSVIYNAAKAISGKGKVSVELTRQPDNDAWVEVDISDTGCGIPTDKLETIFDYGVSDWGDGKGIGYGLWRGRSILRNMDGDIWVKRSVVGEGSTFTIVLPARQSEMKADS
jgi:GAF domain-containing protein